MKAKLTEHDERLQLVIACEDYEEWILLRAFLRENATAQFVPLSTKPNGNWTITLGTCGCEARSRSSG